MASDPIEIPVIFDMSGVDSLADRVNTAVDKASDKVRGGLSSGFNAAEKASTRAMGSIKTAVDGVSARVSVSSRGMAAFGEVAGKVGRLPIPGFQALGSTLEATSKGMAALGPLAIGGAAAAGLGLVAASAFKLVDAAAASAAALEKLGATDAVTQDQIDRVNKAGDAIGALKAASDVATVSIGSALAPAVERVSKSTAEMLLFVGKIAGTFETGALSVERLGNVMAAFVLGPIKLVVDGSLAIHRVMGTNTAAMEGAAAAFDEFAISTVAAGFAVTAETEAQRASLAVTASVADLTTKVTAARIKDTEAAKAHAKAVEAASKEAEDYEKKRAAAVAALFAAGDDKAASERFAAEIAAHERQIELKKLLVAEIIKQRDAEKAASKATDATTVSVDGTSDAITRAASLSEQWANNLGDLPDTMATIGDAFGQLGDGVSALIDVQIDRFKELGEAGKQHARELWAVQQGLAIAQTWTAAAVAAVQALAQLGPVAGPIAVAGIVATTVAGSLATIMATAPEFDTGTGAAMPIASRGQQDQFLATLYRGEGVLTRRGVDAVGGPAAINNANAGTPSPGSSGPAVVSVEFRGRVLDRMITETARSGGAFAAVLDSIASPPGVARVWG